jgi:hypothetical protein
VYPYFSRCGLFNGAVGCSDNFASYHRLINKCLNGRDMEGSGRNII